MTNELAQRSPQEISLSKIFTQTADALYGNLVQVRANFERTHSVIPAKNTRAGMTADSAFSKLDEAHSKFADRTTDSERRIRGIIDVLEYIAHYYTPEIPDLFEGYTVGPKYNGQDYFPETNVEGYSGRTEPAILFAIKLRAEGKPVPERWDELVVKTEWGERATLLPREPISLPEIPNIIDITPSSKRIKDPQR